jgi:tight adherence protein B
MGVLIAQDWFAIPVFGILIFILTYMWSDKVIDWLYYRSLGQRAEVVRLLEAMFIEVNESRVTAIMLLISFGLGFIFFLLCWPNIVAGALIGFIVSMLGASLPKVVVGILWEKRCGKFVDQMVDGMTIMANGIKAGLTPAQSMERVVENLSNPIKQEFTAVLSEVRLGTPLEAALVRLGERIPRQDVQMFVTAINILKETGGNLAETFDTISFTIRERQKIEKKIEALTTQGITQGIIITLVPFVLMIVLFLIDPGFVKPLFTTPLGLFFLFIMLVLQIVGGLAIRKIVKIQV